MVVIVDANQLPQLQVTSLGGGLRSQTLHGASVSEEAVSVVVEQLEAGLVERGGAVGLGHSQTNSIGKTLAQRTGGNLHAGGVVLQARLAFAPSVLQGTYSFGVARSLGSEVLQTRVSQHTWLSPLHPPNLRGKP